MNRRLWLCMMLAAGCGESASNEAAPAPNPVVRATVESPVPEPPKPRFGWDGAGHLAAADALVHGFEVPQGLGSPKTFRSFVDFEITATMSKLEEFYLGREAGSGRRFTERRYLIDKGKNGFEVWHTDESLGRLGLDERYKKAHLFITPGPNRTKILRVHLPPEPGKSLVDEFIPQVEDREQAQLKGRTIEAASQPTHDAPATGGNTAGANTAGGNGAGGNGAGGNGAGGKTAGSGSRKQANSGGNPGTGNTGNGTDSQDDTGLPKPPPGATTADIRRRNAGQASSSDHPGADAAAVAKRVRERYGPYPPTRRRDARPLIQKWQAENPGKTFLD